MAAREGRATRVDGSPAIAVTLAELASLAERAGQAPRVALDLEANGRFAFRARVSTLQFAFNDEVALVDPLAPGLAGTLEPLRTLLSEAGPVKVIHDVGFDARLLAEADLYLGNVHDTALVAQWLGRPSTGLRSLALTELGVTLDKSLQAQDWAARPLSEASLRYLADDVGHLLALDERLWAEAVQANIVEEVLEETTYRLASAVKAIREPDPRPPFTKLKGIDKLGAAELAVLRRVVMARESEAERLDTPAGELTPSAVLVAIARAKPVTREALARVRSPIARQDPENVGQAILQAVRAGIQDGQLSPEDQAWFDQPTLPPAEIKTRRDREARLSAWRKAEAKTRQVNEQVVLPGHCASELVATCPIDTEGLERIGGLGQFRVARYGEAILRALKGEAPP